MPSRVPRLPIALRPEPGEDVRGFLRRLADAHGHRSISVFSQALGLGTAFGPTSAGRFWGRLAQAADLTEAEVYAMRWGLTGEAGLGSQVVVAGARTLRGFTYPMVVRLCPACLRETGILRSFWSFTCVVACPRHGTLLATACACGRPLMARLFGKNWTCMCGVAVAHLPATAAPETAVEVARELAARVGTASGCESQESSLPPPFNAVCAHDYMALVHTLGLAATTPAHEDAPVPLTRGESAKGFASARPPLDVSMARLRAATRILRAWPDAYMDLLRKVDGRNTAVSATEVSGAFATSIGRLLVQPIRGAEGAPLEILTRTLSQYWDQSRNERPGARGSRHRRNGPRLQAGDDAASRVYTACNLTTLARALGFARAPRLLKRVVRRVLAQLTEEERNRPTADLADLLHERAVALYRASAAAMTSLAARRLIEGKTRTKALFGWDHPRLLPVDPVLTDLRMSGRPVYAPEAVAAALARLRALARGVERSDGLMRLVRATDIRYSKTDLLLDVFDGRLSVYATVDAPRLHDLFVVPEDASRARFARYFDRRLACGDEFARAEQINTVLQGMFGSAMRVAALDLRLLARSGIIRFRTERKSTRRSVRTRSLYNVRDAIDWAGRSSRPTGLLGSNAQEIVRLEGTSWSGGRSGGWKC